MKRMYGIQLPSPGSACLNKDIFNFEEAGYALSVTFASLFDIIGVYQVVVVKDGKHLVGICNESHYDAVAEAMAKIPEAVPEKQEADRLCEALYNFLLEMDGDDLHKRQPYMKND